MTAYILLILVFLYSAYFNRSKQLGLIIFAFLFILCFFRGPNVGIDTPAYYYNDMTFGSNGLADVSSYELEYSTLFFRRFIESNHLPSRFLLFGIAIITYFFLYKASKSFGVNLVLFCLFFYLFNFFFHTMNIARQLSASAIILYAYSFLDKKNHYFYIILVLFATSIHFSSVIFLLFYLVRFLPVIKLGNNDFFVYVFFTIFFIIAPFIADRIYGDTMGVFGNFGMYSRFEEEMAVNTKSFKDYLVEYINLMISCRVFIWLKKNESNRIVSNLFLISLVLGVLAGTLFGIISRALISINTIRIIGFSLFFAEKEKSTRNERAVILTLLLLVNMYLINSAIFQGNYGVYPYYMTLPF